MLMKRTYYKLNEEDVMEIVSEYLAEQAGYKTFGTNTRIFSDGESWNMVIAIGEADDMGIHRIDMEKLNSELEYNGTHGQPGYWQSDKDIKRTIDSFIKNNENERRVKTKQCIWKGIKLIILMSIAAFILYWLFSIGICEYNTYVHGNEFDSFPALVDPESKVKVLEYGNDTARIYTESGKYGNGNIITYKKENGNWYFDRWETVWSGSGSADGFVWPYIR